jgi:hypothetical protein
MNDCETDNKCCGRNCAITVAVVVACLIFAGLVWKMRQYTTPAPLGAERMAERAKALGELRAAEADALQNPGWIDQTKGLVRLPIADAMKLAEREWQDPAKARADLIARATKAAFVPPPPPSPLE